MSTPKRSEHLIFDELTGRPSMAIIVESGVEKGLISIYSRPPNGGPEDLRIQLTTINGKLAYNVGGMNG